VGIIHGITISDVDLLHSKEDPTPHSQIFNWAFI